MIRRMVPRPGRERERAEEACALVCVGLVAATLMLLLAGTMVPA